MTCTVKIFVVSSGHTRYNLCHIIILDTHPVAVLQHKDIILKCLDDKDESIRLRSLDLISKMVSKSSLMEIAQKLLEHAKKTENMIYRNELVLKMIQMCSQNNYANIVNFEWYLNILLDLAKLHGKSTFGDVLGQFYHFKGTIKYCQTFSNPRFYAEILKMA